MPSRRLTLGAILLFLFLPAIAIRAGEFRYPLGDGQQWLTSTVVRTQQIWAEDGIGHWRFLPVMSYGLAADKNIDNQASFPDAKGNWYYTSYGPLSYITPYLVTRLFGIPPTAAFLGWFNIGLHAATAILLFLLVVAVTRPRLLRDYVPAIIAFVIYVWTPETLWYHSKPYMADMFVQPLVALGALLFIRNIERPRKTLLVSIAFISVLAVTSEWLGLFFCVALTMWSIGHGKDLAARHAAMAAAGGAVLGVALILLHYSMIAGLDAFIAAARAKYAIRSGAAPASAFTLLGLDGWRVIAKTYWIGYWPVLTALGLMATTVSWKRNPDRSGDDLWKAALFVTAVPVALHHLLFFDFTAVHPFSALKTAIPLSLLGAFLAQRALDKHPSSHGSTFARFAVAAALLVYPVSHLAAGAPAGARGRLLVAELVLVLLASIVAISSVRRRGRSALMPARYAMGLLLILSTAGSIVAYKAMAFASRSDWHFYLGATIARRARPDEVIFIADARNAAYPAYPMTVLYAHRNLAEWRGLDSALALVRLNRAAWGVLFSFDSSGTAAVTRFEVAAVSSRSLPVHRPPAKP